MPDPLSYLDALLRARVHLAEARQLRVGPTNAIRDGIVPTPRLIYFRSGSARYSLEGSAQQIGPHTALLVPALSRRDWSADSPVVASFFAFHADPVPAAPGVLIARDAIAVGVAIDALLPIAGDTSRAGQLRLEAAMKHILAMFLTAAAPLKQATASPAADRAIADAAQWLSKNLALADPLEHLHERAGLSEHQFRRRFKALLLQSPRDYLLGLRMRQARFHLAETTLPVKQIARRVGYDDPLYFSRRYFQFWKRRPTEERS